MSGKVSVVSDHAAIEGRFLEYYRGQWANDGAPVCGALSVIRPTLIYIRLSLVASGTSPKHLNWQVQISVTLFSLDFFTALQGEDRIMA